MCKGGTEGLAAGDGYNPSLALQAFIAQDKKESGSWYDQGFERRLFLLEDVFGPFPADFFDTVGYETNYPREGKRLEQVIKMHTIVMSGSDGSGSRDYENLDVIDLVKSKLEYLRDEFDIKGQLHQCVWVNYQSLE